MTCLIIIIIIIRGDSLLLVSAINEVISYNAPMKNVLKDYMAILRRIPTFSLALLSVQEINLFTFLLRQLGPSLVRGFGHIQPPSFMDNVLNSYLIYRN